jgi:hypothetical protein
MRQVPPNEGAGSDVPMEGVGIDPGAFGPTTPKRAARLADASVDPTEARCAEVEKNV